MSHLPKTVTFDGIEISIVDINDVPWVRGAHIGKALGYADPADAIQKIYERRSDEFTASMTAVVRLPDLDPQTGGAGQARDVRILSPRGCHLIGMFARTERAKRFRQWVLDVLDRELSGQATSPTHPKPSMAECEIPESAENDNLKLRKVTVVKELFGNRSGRQFYLKLGLDTVPAMFEAMRQGDFFDPPPSAIRSTPATGSSVPPAE
ncbi:BRO-N domain-containing protein [Azospirillum argentinense]